ncbi:MAG: metal ABC transporter substrate-binding protein [Eggerthellaceae bacterium]|jgi:zinc transport system substrate-binding protein|nr:metal ABC transporter substrate-binding protein [Eggerthellaceae bacterium]MDR2716015.1 metal ABC transporter substrate-binding protein [Coriobacteriaceae bacterium]
MKRYVAALLAVLLLMPVASGCTSAGQPHTGAPSVVCTIFPQYDWVCQILGDEADSMDVALLLNSKIDLHNYQPSVDDIVKISTCDLFIYVGGESDSWVEDVLRDAANKDMVVINLLDVLGDAAKEEEALEGMEEEEEGPEDADADGADYDEHVWLSLRNAQVLCTAIAEALSSLDADNAGRYADNLTAYIEELRALDAEYRLVTDTADVKTLLFGDRFPFRYLMDDYGLTPYAAFSGCSAETEASFETIVFLANKVDELGLNAVMVTESADHSIAQAIISNTSAQNQRILVLDSLQSVAAGGAGDKATYLSIMEGNLDVLRDALR